MDEIKKINKLRKKHLGEDDEDFEIDENSDIPVSEKKVKDKKIRWV